MKGFDHHRLVLGYHGCDQKVRDQVLQEGARLKPSMNEYDWLGKGIYFWEHGPKRALEWAEQQEKRGRIKNPSVIGAVLHLGNCFDLMDSGFTDLLSKSFPQFRKALIGAKKSIPKNRQAHPDDCDYLLRELDCAVINWTFDRMKDQDLHFNSVRGMFQESAEVYPGSAIRRRSHVQIAIRDSNCIIGYFSP